MGKGRRCEACCCTVTVAVQACLGTLKARVLVHEVPTHRDTRGVIIPLLQPRSGTVLLNYKGTSLIRSPTLFPRTTTGVVSLMIKELKAGTSTEFLKN